MMVWFPYIASLFGHDNFVINQYARRANQDGSIFEEDIQNILNLMQKIIDLIGDVIDRLEEMDE